MKSHNFFSFFELILVKHWIGRLQATTFQIGMALGKILCIIVMEQPYKSESDLISVLGFCVFCKSSFRKLDNSVL